MSWIRRGEAEPRMSTPTLPMPSSFIDHYCIARKASAQGPTHKKRKVLNLDLIVLMSNTDEVLLISTLKVSVWYA